jgi:cytochrome c-type biogenesis protein CcmH
MTRPRRPAWLLGCFAALLALAFAAPLPAQVDRARQVGGKFMCMCGCNQVLTQCNHVGCTTSTAMLKQLDDSVARGDSEEVMTQNFVQEFGTKVYAEPPKTGLSLVAWVLPGVYLVLGTLLVIFIISRWRTRSPLLAATAGGPAGISPTALERARQRVARETED